MAQTQLIDETAAVDLVRVVFRQCRVDLVRSRVDPEDRISAIEFLLVFGGFADGDEYDNADVGGESGQQIRPARLRRGTGAEVARTNPRRVA